VKRRNYQSSYLEPQDVSWPVDRLYCSGSKRRSFNISLPSRLNLFWKFWKGGQFVFEIAPGSTLKASLLHAVSLSSTLEQGDCPRRGTPDLRGQWAQSHISKTPGRHERSQNSMETHKSLSVTNHFDPHTWHDRVFRSLKRSKKITIEGTSSVLKHLAVRYRTLLKEQPIYFATRWICWEFRFGHLTLLNQNTWEIHLFTTPLDQPPHLFCIYSHILFRFRNYSTSALRVFSNISIFHLASSLPPNTDFDWGGCYGHSSLSNFLRIVMKGYWQKFGINSPQQIRLHNTIES